MFNNNKKTRENWAIIAGAISDALKSGKHSISLYAPSNGTISMTITPAIETITETEGEMKHE